MKRATALAVTILLLAAVFAGCGAKTPVPDGQSEAFSVTETTSTVPYEASSSLSQPDTTAKTTTALTTVATTVTTTVETTTTAVTATRPATTTRPAATTKPVTTTRIITTAAPTTKKADTVTISIECSDILTHTDKLRKGKAPFVPPDGVILPATEVPLESGDTVFDVLQRVCGERDIQIEYMFSIGFNTYYIEGIAQLYEKDCGTRSGWIYEVNGAAPNVGCSAYALSPGDVIAWRYSCEEKAP